MIVIIRVALALQAFDRAGDRGTVDGIIRRQEHRADPAVGGEIAES